MSQRAAGYLNLLTGALVSLLIATLFGAASVVSKMHFALRPVAEADLIVTGLLLVFVAVGFFLTGLDQL